MDLYHQVLALVIMLVVVVLAQASKSYYDILGVKKTDSTSVIKKAFRNLAMKYHPDKNPDKKNAEAQFREIVEAYEVLSDPEKKKQYDAMGSSGSFGGGSGGNQNFNSNHEHFQNFNYNEFFKDFDEAMKRHHHQHHQQHNKAHFHAHRENLKNSGFTFDFDDLFEDFGFGDFGGFGAFDHLHDAGDDFMGSSFVQEMNMERNGQRCKTIKKKEGNTIITHTECH